MPFSSGKKYWRALAGGAVVLAGFAAGSIYLGTRAVDEMVDTSARSRAQTFAAFLEADPDRINALLLGLARDPEAETRIRTVANLSHIASFAIFDERGAEVFATGSRGNAWLIRDRAGGIGGGDRLSPSVLERAGSWLGRIEEGTDQPTFVMPLAREGETVAYLSARIDMRPERQGFTRTLAFTSLQLFSILFLTIGIPTLFRIRRKRKMREADERIQFLHNHDALTNLLNRRRMHEESDRILATARATRERMAVWFMDVDGLGEINDTLGQAAGDELLQVIAGRLAEIVDGTDLLARIGADDFAILQRQVRGEDHLRMLVHRIVGAVSRPIEMKGQMVTPRLSFGIALSPEHGRTYAELVKHAELAFLQQKTSRRGDYTLFQSWMDEEMHRRRMVEHMMRMALENDGFELFYQPIMAGDCETLVGFEALLRMPDGNGGYVPPSTFIPIAEARGYIKDIGNWVIREACRQTAEWPDHLFVSVNLSAVQFRDRDLVDIVRDALAAAGIEGRRIEIEVVESLIMDQSEDVLEQLRALRALGISIDMDDFGTGYSSLGYLWRFPFDKLKIDQSFMHALREGQSSASRIVETIISLAHHLDLKVTAEGIETREQAELLRSFGCDQLQGYYFGKPKPAREAAAEVLKKASARLPSPVEIERTEAPAEAAAQVA